MRRACGNVPLSLGLTRLLELSSRPRGTCEPPRGASPSRWPCRADQGDFAGPGGAHELAWRVAPAVALCRETRTLPSARNLPPGARPRPCVTPTALSPASTVADATPSPMSPARASGVARATNLSARPAAPRAVPMAALGFPPASSHERVSVPAALRFAFARTLGDRTGGGSARPGAAVRTAAETRGGRGCVSGTASPRPDAACRAPRSGGGGRRVPAHGAAGEAPGRRGCLRSPAPLGGVGARV